MSKKYSAYAHLGVVAFIEDKGTAQITFLSPQVLGTIETMKPIVSVLSVFIAVYFAVFPLSVEAAQQCVSCSSSDCLKSNPQTKSCDE